MLGLPDLRNNTFFPPLSRLPHDVFFTHSERDYYSVSTEFYGFTATSTIKPRKHWCLLAEIVEIEMWPFRPIYTAKDITGETFFVAFHFEDRTKFPVVSKKAVVGSTICVMYANFHDFVDGKVGVRLEEPKNVAILPLGLKGLLTSADIVRGLNRANTSTNDTPSKQLCVACGNHASKRCSLCSAAAYCSRECQAKDWSLKHRKDCVVIRQMKSWGEFDWERYDTHKGFADFV